MITTTSAQQLTDSLTVIETHLVGLADALKSYGEAMTGEYRATFHKNGFTQAEGLDASLGPRHLDVLVMQRLRGLQCSGLHAAARAGGALDAHWGDRLRERIEAAVKAAAA